MPRRPLFVAARRARGPNPGGRPARRWRLPADRNASARGQALVEFAAVLLPLLLIVAAIVQFGLLFGASVTLTNAAREGARAGTVYVYDGQHTRSWNDAARCGAILDAAVASFGILSPSSPHFSATTSGDSCTNSSGETQVNGDLTVSYCDHVTTTSGPCPNSSDTTTTCAPDTREGCLVRVTLTYRSDIVIPLIGELLTRDGNGRFVHTTTATMVIN